VVARLVVLISGGGSNLKAFLDSLPSSGIPAEVVAVGADSEAAGLLHARERSIPTFVVSTKDFPTREAWGEALVQEIDRCEPEWIVLSGFMKLLPPGVVSHFSHMLINTHPSFLPEFPGAHGVRDALAAGVSETGASVILVDDGVDSGPILAQERVPVLDSDTEQSLHERIKVVERRLLLDVMESLVTPPSPEPEGREHE